MNALEVTVSEKEFMANVVELATLLGWRSYHTHDSRRSAPGFPDCVFVRDARLLFAELKTERGRLTLPQRSWLAALRQCRGAEVYEWRPSDWLKIEAVLR